MVKNEKIPMSVDLGIFKLIFTHHHHGTSSRVGEEGIRLQSQEGQDLCGTVATDPLILKTSTEPQTVHLTNKDMTKDS